jgi:hypothetical protein
MTSSSTPPNGWREHAATVALVVVVVAVLALAYHVLHDLSLRAARGEGVREALDFQHRMMGYAAMLVLLTSSMLAVVLWRVGRATAAQERFPPEGVPKVLDAEPRKGVAAIYLGRRLCLAALIAGLGGLALALVAALYLLRA